MAGSAARIRTMSGRVCRANYPGFPIWIDGHPHGGVHRAAPLVGELIPAPQHLDCSHSGDPWGVLAPACPGLVTPTVPFRDLFARGSVAYERDYLST